MKFIRYNNPVLSTFNIVKPGCTYEQFLDFHGGRISEKVLESMILNDADIIKIYYPIKLCKAFYDKNGKTKKYKLTKKVYEQISCFKESYSESLRKKDGFRLLTDDELSEAFKYFNEISLRDQEIVKIEKINDSITIYVEYVTGQIKLCFEKVTFFECDGEVNGLYKCDELYLFDNGYEFNLYANNLDLRIHFKKLKIHSEWNTFDLKTGPEKNLFYHIRDIAYVKKRIGKKLTVLEKNAEALDILYHSFYLGVLNKNNEVDHGGFENFFFRQNYIDYAGIAEIITKYEKSKFKDYFLRAYSVYCSDKPFKSKKAGIRAIDMEIGGGMILTTPEFFKYKTVEQSPIYKELFINNKILENIPDYFKYELKHNYTKECENLKIILD